MDDAPGPQGRPRRKPRLPDIRSQQPVEALETARESLAEAPRETVAGRGARKVVSKVMAGRDERHDAVAKGLADAIEELAARVAELGDRINRVNDELPETADRADDAVASAQELASAQQELIERLERLDLQVETESDRVDGALEQDVITGTILADAEARLTAEVADLQLRIDKLADDPPDLDLADDEHADPGSAAEPDRGADRRSRKASRRSG